MTLFLKFDYPRFFRMQVMVISGIQNGTNFQSPTFFINLETDNSWTQGPPLIIPRNGAKAWRLRKNSTTHVFCTIVAGGIFTILDLAVTKTEILCDDSSNWAFGPELPVPMTAAYMTEFPDGEGLLYVAGNKNPANNGILNSVYFLRDCSSAWYLYNTTLTQPRYGHIAQWMPCSNFYC